MSSTEAAGRRAHDAPGELARSRHWENKDAGAAIAFLTPGLFMFTLFVLVPIAGGLVLSFFRWDLLNPPAFVGLANYGRLLHDSLAISALGRTALYVVLGVIPTMFIGFLTALLLDTRFPGVSIVRTLYYMPIVVSFAASGVLWRTIYDPQNGVINSLLLIVGIHGPAWLANTFWALPSLVVIMIWLALPVTIILYMAGLQRVPDSMLEAARIDGARTWTLIWGMIWPNVSQTTLLVAIVLILNFSLGTFDLVSVVTQGGPLNSTLSLVYYTYQAAIQQLQLGYAATLAIFQLVVILAVLGVLRLAMLARRALT